MHFPRALRKQLIEYEKAGFTITEIEVWGVNFNE